MNSSHVWLLMAAFLAVIIIFFILLEHWVHALGLAPYFPLLTCLLMHLFNGHTSDEDDPKKIHPVT